MDRHIQLEAWMGRHIQLDAWMGRHIKQDAWMGRHIKQDAWMGRHVRSCATGSVGEWRAAVCQARSLIHLPAAFCLGIGRALAGRNMCHALSSSLNSASASACASASASAYPALPCLVLFSASRCSPGTHSSIRSQSSPPQHPGPHTRAWEPATQAILRLYFSSSAAAAAALSRRLHLHLHRPHAHLAHRQPPLWPSNPTSINQPVGSVASQPNFSGPSLATFRILSFLF